MMNDASYLRAETILAAFSRAGARVTVVTAKDKLRRLLGHGVTGTCVSIEAGGIEVYSAALSEQALAEGARLLASSPPDLMYLSTSDYVQHKHAPGDAEANRFYGAIDRSLAEIDRLGATLVDHRRPRHAREGRRRRTGARRCSCRTCSTAGSAPAPRASCCRSPIRTSSITARSDRARWCTWPLRTPPRRCAGRIQALTGIDVAVARDEACRRFDLPPDRTGDIVVFSDGDTVIGTRPADHDLSALDAPLRSHGGRAEQEVPLFANRPVARPTARGTTTTRSTSR